MTQRWSLACPWCAQVQCVMLEWHCGCWIEHCRSCSYNAWDSPHDGPYFDDEATDSPEPLWGANHPLP